MQSACTVPIGTLGEKENDSSLTITTGNCGHKVSRDVRPTSTLAMATNAFKASESSEADTCNGRLGSIASLDDSAASWSDGRIFCSKNIRSGIRTPIFFAANKVRSKSVSDPSLARKNSEAFIGDTDSDN